MGCYTSGLVGWYATLVGLSWGFPLLDPRWGVLRVG